MNLIAKYNVPAPRYTSYPTVPYWDTQKPDISNWCLHVKNTFDKYNAAEGISLYIHLPYCESLCTYCGCNTRITINHTVEEPYINAVLKEWNLYKGILKDSPVIKEIHLGGGTPTFFSAENLKKLISGLLEGARLHENKEFSFEAHPNNTRLCHLKTLYELGFRRVSFGIQDFDIKVQEIINRIQPYEQVRNVVDMARDVGYSSINFDLVYGLPKQTRSSVINTINKVNTLRPDRIAFYSYAHVPWIKPGQRKFTEADLPVDVEKRALYELGRTMFLDNDYEEIGMDHFALKTDSLYKASQSNSLHRNFMGYTHGKTHLLLGLGVSSISDTWDAFAQNVKTVEEYINALNNNTLPIFKGHELTDEDLYVRKHILSVMCSRQTTWDNIPRNQKFILDVKQRLQEMEHDGLVKITNEGLVVTKAGKPFLRNVCMAFDVRLWDKATETKMFSAAI